MQPLTPEIAIAPQPQPQPRPRISELLLFAGNFLRHPHMLGSVIPSSRALVNQVLERVDWERARVIVEYGPGVGTFTSEILRRMLPEARLIVIETNGDFVRFLRDSMPDPRLQVVQDSATEVRTILQRCGIGSAHYVISGIPLGSMPEPVRREIAEKTRAVLEADGAFLVYQFTPRVLPALRSTFPRVRRGFQPWNIPPAQVFTCELARRPGTESLA